LATVGPLLLWTDATGLRNSENSHAAAFYKCEVKKMKYRVTWKRIAFPDMDLPTYVDADNADAAKEKAEAEEPADFQDVYYIDDVQEVE
jgi:hypothetical protein